MPWLQDAQDRVLVLPPSLFKPGQFSLENGTGSAQTGLDLDWRDRADCRQASPLLVANALL